MTTTRKRKALGVLLGLAVAVFLADRVLGLIPMGPQEAEASISPAAMPLEDFGEQMRATAAMSALPPMPRTLAGRLAEMAGKQGLDGMAASDAFRPPAGWTHEAPVAAATVTPDLARLRAQQFAERHRLTATAVSADGGMAIIDGQCLAVGREMDGLQLKSVDRSSATLENGDVRVTLRLSKE